jgi:6-pyruvoyltetrahydropterin/6-carboxytetrahydropterin synthase
MRFDIQKEIEFDAGHRVPRHESKCKNPHGHRYRVVAHLVGQIITEGPESGMVRDFGNVKDVLMREVHDVFDHGFIVHALDQPMLKALGVFYDPEHNEYTNPMGWKVIVVPYFPTAELLAQDIYARVKPWLPNIESIDVWETPTSCASYREEAVSDYAEPRRAVQD